jgi:hypothetical protein
MDAPAACDAAGKTLRASKIDQFTARQVVDPTMLVPLQR